MSLADLGALGEFIAAIVVMITLVYLSIQVRQNTTALKNSQSQQFIDLNHNVVGPLIGDREVAEIWMKASGDFDSAVPEEWRIWRDAYDPGFQQFMDPYLDPGKRRDCT